MAAFPNLIKPGYIGRLQLKNRMVMAPMVTGSCERDGNINPRTIAFYKARAAGGAGLIIVQATIVTPRTHPPSFLALYNDSFIPGLRELTRTVKESGARIAIQLVHYGHQLADPGRRHGLSAADMEIVSASAVRPLLFDETPRELSRNDIGGIVEDFANAAGRARQAGFDAVEFHGAHGKLISQFLSPFYNRRSDEYGGSIRGRAKFACDILRGAREQVGPDFPLIMRLDGYDGFEGGLSLNEAVQAVPYLEGAGADALHVSAGADEGCHWQWITYLQSPGHIVHLAEAIKRASRLPVIAVGRLSDPAVAEKVLAEGRADFIALGRSLLADPELPNKVREGRAGDIRRCLYCNNCLAHNRTRGLRCTVNPSLLRESEFVLTSTPLQKKIMVIGGGPGGMQAAAIAAGRGHKVVLYEQTRQLGGRWNIVCRQDGKNEFSGLTDRLLQEMSRGGARVMLGKKVTLQLVEEVHPNAVILAAGAGNASLNIPGIAHPKVVQATDVIMARAGVGQRVVVVGARHLGMEVAASLAKSGRKVSLVSRSSVGRGLTLSLKYALREKLVEYGVYQYPNCQPLAVSDDGLIVLHERAPLFLRADTVVLAVGSVSQRELADDLKSLVDETYEVGDCVEPRDAQAAVNEGAEAGFRV